MKRAKIPKRVDDTVSTVCMDANQLAHSATHSDPISKVLDDDDLIMEIMVRLGFPTSLVHATLVCKRWFRHGSHPAFLHRFRKLHPPRILGFCVHNMLDRDIPRFVPMLPQPPELDVVIRHAKLSLDTYNSMRIHIVDFHNSKVFMHLTTTVQDSLYLLRGMTIFPQLPPCQLQDGSFCTLSDLVYKEEGDTLSYFYVWMESTGQLTNSTVHLYTLQDGSWCRLTSIAIADHYFMPRARRPLLVDNKIYIASQSNILVLNLSTSSFSIVQLPQGVEYHGVGDTMLSRANDDSGVHLIHTNKVQLDIWLHKTDNTICLHELFSHLRKTDRTFEDGHIGFPHINQVGKNVEFVFLQLGPSLLYLDIKCKTLSKVYEVSRDCVSHHIHPFMMIWPPTFPALKDDHARFSFFPLDDATEIRFCFHFP